MSEPLLQLRNVRKTYPVLRAGLFTRQVGEVVAVEDVSLDLGPGETLGVVGASGCGKSTLARVITALEHPTSGQVLFRGQDVTALGGKELIPFRRAVQIVFQDPYESLNPTMSVGALVTEPWRIHKTVPRAEWRSRAEELLASVGVDPSYYDRRPGRLSGGERQRIGIARALALEPELLICDEPASALDVSVQAQILVLLQRLQAELGLSFVFISHDLTVVRYVAERVAVMDAGRIVETGTREEVFERPRHDVTRGLLEAAGRLHGGGARRAARRSADPVHTTGGAA